MMLILMLSMFVGGVFAGIAGAVAWLNPKQERLMTVLRRQDLAMASETRSGAESTKAYRATYARLEALSDQHGKALEEIKILRSLCITPSDLEHL